MPEFVDVFTGSVDVFRLFVEKVKILTFQPETPGWRGFWKISCQFGTPLIGRKGQCLLGFWKIICNLYTIRCNSMRYPHICTVINHKHTHKHMNNTHEILMLAGPALLALAYVATRIQSKAK